MKDTMVNMTLCNIAKACGGTLYGGASPIPEDYENTEITSAVIDSRKLIKGGLFLAAKGEKTDGHQYIAQVYQEGAICVITEKTPEQTEEAYGVRKEAWGPYILVEDTFAALKQIAAFYRKQLTIPIVGITGSVGKTSTKEFVAGVLSVKYRVLKTEGNFNNEIGLPLTILGIRREHEVAVVEMGISEFGEMSRLGEMARPDICVITNIGQCHLENLHDRNGVFKAKTEIFEYMQENGEVCLNGEDDLLSMVSTVNGKAVHHFGISEKEGFEVYAGEIEDLGLLGSRAMMHMKNPLTDEKEDGAGEEIYPVKIPLPGQHMVINAMAAALVGRLLGLMPEEIQSGISQVEPVGGRSNILWLPNITVIDDCYNANPASMKAAINLLATALGRRTAILGDMFELGKESDRMHASIGAYAIEQGIDVLFCVGENARFMYDAALDLYDGTQDIRYYADREELLESLPDLLEKGDTVLVKASHGMGFEKVVEYLKVNFN